MQLELIHETAEDALKSAIAVLGGPKKVACQLRPSWEAERARSWLSNALDPARPEKLEINDVIWILREAKRAGFHQAMQYLAQQCEYEARPIEPQEHEAALVSVIQSAAETVRKASAQLESLRTSNAVRVIKTA